MTDHRPSRTAREEAIAHIQAVRDFWSPLVPTPGTEIDDIPTDLLRRLADERHMAACSHTNDVGNRCELLAGHRGPHTRQVMP